MRLYLVTVHQMSSKGEGEGEEGGEGREAEWASGGQDGGRGDVLDREYFFLLLFFLMESKSGGGFSVFLSSCLPSYFPSFPILPARPPIRRRRRRPPQPALALCLRKMRDYGLNGPPE